VQSKSDLAREYESFRFGTTGLGLLVHDQMDDEVFCPASIRFTARIASTKNLTLRGSQSPKN